MPRLCPGPLKTVLLPAAIVAALVSTGGVPRAAAQVPRPRPPAVPAALARFVPARGLVFYAEFDGLDDHAAVWRKSAAYQIVNRTKLGALLEAVAAQGFDVYREEDAQGLPRGAEAVAFVERLFRSGFVVATTAAGARPTVTLLVVRRGGVPAVRGLIERLDADPAGAKVERPVVEKGGRKIVYLGRGDRAAALWEEQGDLVVCSAGGVDRVLGVLKGQEASVLGNPTRIALARAEAGFDRVGLVFLDQEAGIPISPELVRLGWDGLKRVEYRVGFQGDALMSILRVIAPSPRRGVLALLDQPTFDRSALPPLPAGISGFTAVSANPARLYDQVVALWKASAPGASMRVAAWEEARRDALGMDLRKDLLPHLGPWWAAYSRPRGRVPVGTAPSLADLTISVSLDDAAAVARAVDPLIAGLNAQLAAPRPDQRRSPGTQPLQIRKLKGVRPSFALSFPPGMLPQGPLSNLEPTLIVGKDRLILAGGIAAAESASLLANRTAARWTPAGAYVPLVRQLSPALVFLKLNDPRETLPGFVANLPVMARSIQEGIAPATSRESPIWIDPALMPAANDLTRYLYPGSYSATIDPRGIRVVVREAFPGAISPAAGAAVSLLYAPLREALEAARRARCSNHLKEIGLAFSRGFARRDVLPPASIVDKDGKPLLSWRVAILPALGLQDLHDRFKLDEPWDSPHNRRLLAAMPPVFDCPSLPKHEPYATPYRTFAGPGALLEPGRETTLKEVADGTSSTLAVVEARVVVPWTKPDELAFVPDPADPLYGAGSPHAGGFHALFADGNVRFLKSTIAPRVLEALITRAGGEELNPNAY